MNYKIITLFVLSFIIVSAITFDDAFAHPKTNPNGLGHYHKYTIPPLDFVEKEYIKGETIPAKCTPDDSAQTTSIVWIIVDSDDNRVLHEKHQSENYSFQANFEVGDYKIKCRTNFGDGSNGSEWKSFSIIEETIVDLAEHPQSINYVEMDYDPDTKDLTISWNFGVNPDRETCNSKTEFYQENYTSINPITYDPNRVYLNFEGYNKDTFGDGSLTLKNTDLTNSEIDCKGSLTINIETIHPSKYTDEFSLYMTFFEVISPDKRSSTPQVGYRAEGIRVLNEAIFITTSLAEINASPCGNFTKGSDKWSFVELIHDITGPQFTIFNTVDGCFTDNTGTVLGFSSPFQSSTTQTPSNKNGSGGGCSGDCTPPTIGVDKNGVRFVEDGLKLNGVTFDGDYFKNHMPMQYTEIGKINHLSLKVYENSGIYNIEKIQFAIVKETGSPINLAEPRIEIDVSNFANDIENASLDGFTLLDKEEIIDYYDVSVSIVPCMDQSTQECLKLDIYWSFAQVPEFNVLAINGWDNNKNPFNNYFNDGLTTIDPNYVEPIPEEPYKYVCNDPPLDAIMNGGDRNNCHWRALHMEWLYK